nr:hypothetical protein [Rhizobium sp. ACO-34A]
MLMPDEFLADIDRRIFHARVAEGDVLRAAGMDLRHLDKVRRGKFGLTEKTYRRVMSALKEVQRAKKLALAEKSDVPLSPVTALTSRQYRLAVAYVCRVDGVMPSEVLLSPPSLRATADAAWLKAARLRRLALYICNTYLNISQADLGRAAGMSRANVCGLLKDIEDLRGEPETEGLLKAIEEAFG